jgi:TolB protein
MIKKLLTHLFIFLVLVFCHTTALPTASAQTELYVRGAGRLFPIALPKLCVSSGTSQAGKEIPEIVTRNLELSGVFQIIPDASHIESPLKCVGESGFAYSDWSVIGAEGLVRGIVSSTPEGLSVKLYLHDVQKQQLVLGKEYSGTEKQIAKIAHRFSNDILKFFTGTSGIFGTQIAYSSKVGRFKELFIMDMDGSNVQQLTDERSLALSASWERSGKGLIYTSYRLRTPDLFLLNFGATKGLQLTKNPHLELGARFSRDGSRLIASITQDRDSDIVMLNERGQITQRITPPNSAIDVSPDWSPDDSQIAFCSNRGGGPQIYVMNSDGSGAHRISFVRSNYCTSPRWSPKGDRIAFVCRADAGFQIFVANPDGSDPLQLTSFKDNEDPDWSPDGNYLAYSSTNSKNGQSALFIMKPDGSTMRQVSSGRGGDFQPSWGPLVP